MDVSLTNELETRNSYEKRVRWQSISLTGRLADILTRLHQRRQVFMHLASCQGNDLSAKCLVSELVVSEWFVSESSS